MSTCKWHYKPASSLHDSAILSTRSFPCQFPSSSCECPAQVACPLSSSCYRPSVCTIWCPRALDTSCTRTDRDASWPPSFSSPASPAPFARRCPWSRLEFDRDVALDLPFRVSPVQSWNFGSTGGRALSRRRSNPCPLALPAPLFSCSCFQENNSQRLVRRWQAVNWRFIKRNKVPWVFLPCCTVFVFNAAVDQFCVATVDGCSVWYWVGLGYSNCAQRRNLYKWNNSSTEHNNQRLQLISVVAFA